MSSQKQAQKRTNCGQKVGSAIKGFDRNGEQFQLKLDSEGAETLQTVAGALLSVFAFLVVGVYTAYQFDIFQKKSGAEITFSVEENFFTGADGFDANDGFALAVGFVDSDDNPMDPEKGELAFYRNAWFLNADGGFEETYEKIPSHICTDADLGLDGGETSQFFPITGSVKELVDGYRASWQCIDKEASQIEGSFDSEVGLMIYVRMHRKCKGEVQCSDVKAANEYFKAGWLLMLNNKIRFDTQKFGAEALVREVQSHWIPVQTQVQQEIPFSVTRSAVNLQDRAFNFDSLTEQSDSSAFTLVRGSTRPFEFFEEDVMALGIDMDLTRTVINRTNYTILDVMSDVGGLESVLASLVSFLLGALNYNNLNSQMISQLFKFPGQGAKGAKKQVVYKSTMLGNAADYILDSLPSCFVCCKKNRRQKQYEAALNRLQEETDIIKLIKQLRFVSKALEYVPLKKDKRKLVEETDFIFLDLDPKTKEFTELSTIMPKLDLEAQNLDNQDQLEEENTSRTGKKDVSVQKLLRSKTSVPSEQRKIKTQDAKIRPKKKSDGNSSEEDSRGKSRNTSEEDSRGRSRNSRKDQSTKQRNKSEKSDPKRRGKT